MRTKSWLLALVGIVLLNTPATWGDFYVIPVPTGVGTKITSLPYAISTPGFYYLTGNLTTAGNAAITVTADDVTIDLMGFSLTCTATSGETNGIIIVGRKNVEIRNGTLSGFMFGINGGGSDHRISNIRAVNGTQAGSTGISLLSTNNMVKSCTASNNKYTGIYVASGTITGCVASDNGNTGILLRGPGSVIGNVVFNNLTHNFSLGNGVATAIMADRNSAFGLNPNYYVVPNTTGVQWGINAGAP